VHDRLRTDAPFFSGKKCTTRHIMIDRLPDTIIELVLSNLRSEPLRCCRLCCRMLCAAVQPAVALSAERRWRVPRPGLCMKGLIDLERQQQQTIRLALKLGQDTELDALVDEFKALDRAVVASQAHRIAHMVVLILNETASKIPGRLLRWTGTAAPAAVRRAGLRLLKALPGWSTRKHAPLMLRFLEDADQHVRNAACRALPFSRLGVEFVEEHQSLLVRAALKNDALTHAIDALGTLGPPRLMRHELALRAHASDKHECVRMAVGRAMAKIAEWRATCELPAEPALSDHGGGIQG
jgi:hypothetical protein